MQAFEERFLSSVDKSGDCWTWTGCVDSHGYGLVRLGGGRRAYAHRLSYEIHAGSIPPGRVIDHMCRVPSCVNPQHLQAVTHKQNMENRAGAHKNSKSGVRGVHWSKDRLNWRAEVRHGGKKHNVGRFDNLADAEAAVIAKRLELHTNNLLDRKAS